MQQISFLQVSPDELQMLVESAVRSVLTETLATWQPPQPASLDPRDRMLSREETAQMLRVSFTTLRSFEERGILRPRRIGRRVLYPFAEVEQALDGRMK